MGAYSYIKAKLLQLGRLKAIDTYVESESIIVYEPDRIISEIPNNGLITKQNALDMITGSSSDIFNGDVVDIPSGTSIPDGYYDIDYSTYIVGHGPNPNIFVLKRILLTEDTEINEIIYDVPVQSISTTQLDTLRVFPHVDPDDPTKTIDDIIILIK